MIPPQPKPPRIIVCLGVNCRANACVQLYDRLRTLLDDPASESDPPFILKTANCLDLCDFGPNLVIHPGNRRFSGVDEAALMQILADEVDAFGQETGT